MGTKKQLSQELPRGSGKHSSAGTHLKSPSSFSCCTSLDTIGLINTLLIIVPMTKYPKMLTGPSQPVLQRRKRSQPIIQAKGHSCIIRFKQSEPSAVTSLGFHRSLGANIAHANISKAEFSLEYRDHSTMCTNIHLQSCNVGGMLQKKNTEKRCASRARMHPYLRKHWYV